MIRRWQQHGEGLLWLAALLFVGVNALAFALARPAPLWLRGGPVALWAIGIGVAWGVLERYRPKRDPFLFPVYTLLTGWGMLLQMRLAPAFTWRHTLWLLIAIALFALAAVGPASLRAIRTYRYTWLTTGLVLLAATLILGVNPSGYGAALWLPLPFINVWFQPSELLKLLTVFFFAGYFAERGHLIQPQQRERWRETLPWIAPLALMWGFGMILLALQQDLGAATLFFLFFLSQLYTATGQRRYYVVGLLLLLVAGLIGWYAYDLVALRIETWWNPWPEFDRRGFQIAQALYALGAGGILGQGIGQGMPGFIPVVHSDFAFAAIAEEWGLIGTLTIVACFALIAQRGLRIALLAANTFRLYLAVGVTLFIAVQALLIMGGVTKLLPLTGVTLPFVSYGGSSLVVVSLMYGLLVYLGGQGHHVAHQPAPRSNQAGSAVRVDAKNQKST